MRLSVGFQRLVVLLCLSATTIGMLPVFLVGALAGEIRGDLAASEATIGVLVAAFFAVSAASTRAVGGYVQRWGWPVGIVMVGLLVGVSAALIATMRLDIVLLACILMVAGVGNGLSHPSANLGLVKSISPNRRGMAFGVKQASVPAATLLAGAALPFIAIEFGWRAPFAILAVLSLAVGGLAWMMTSRVDEGKTDRSLVGDRSSELPGIIWFSVGAGLGSAAANSMGAFLVMYALHLGAESRAAGTLLIAGSAANIAVRLLSGWRADRRKGGHLKTAAHMMFVGAGGVVILAFAPNTGVLIVATLIAFGIGWGWNGLLHHGAMEIYERSAAKATSILQSYLFVGAVVGPLAFGVTAEYVSFRASWTLVALALVVGGLLLLRFLTSREAVQSAS